MNRWFAHVLLILTILALLPLSHIRAQDDSHPIIPAGLSPITSDNAAQLQQVGQIGKGRIFGLNWMDNQIGVATSLGAWVYDAEQLDHLPTEPIIPALADQADAGAFSSDGRLYASGGLNGEIALYDIVTGEKIGTLEGHTGAILDVVFSPDGSLIASDSKDQTVRVWDTTSLNELASFPKGETLDSPMVFTPNSLIWGTSESATAEAGGYTIHTWNHKTGGELVLVRHVTAQSGTYLSAMALSQDGQYLAVGANFELHMWDVESGELAWTQDDHSLNLINYDLAISPDGQWVASATTDLGGVADAIRIFDRATGKLGKAIDDYAGVVNHADFSEDGAWLAASGYDGTLRVWDTASFTEQGRVTGHYGAADHLAMSNDGSRLAAGGFDHVVRVWDMTTGAELPTLEPGWFASIEGVAWSPNDSNLLAIANHVNSDYKIWDTDTSTEIPTGAQNGDNIFSGVFGEDGAWLAMMQNSAFTVLLVPFDGSEASAKTFASIPPTTALFSSDGRLLASGDETGTIHLWDTESGKPLMVFLQDGSVKKFAFSPDASLLASAGDGGRVWVWDVATGDLVAELPAGTTEVSSLAFSADNHLIAVGGDDGTIRLMDIANQTELAVLAGHYDSVTSLLFTPDGTALLSGSYDSTVRVWGIQP